MHQLIKDDLEEILQGDPRYDRHLAACAACREAVEAMRRQGETVRSLRSAAAPEPAAGFYAKVMELIEAQRKPSFWAAFVEPVFAKRIVFASLVFLVLFGGYLVTTESDGQVPSGGPETIFADTQSRPALVGTDQQHDRDAILATLTTYQE
jgi:anti-sigma factor RsiW